MTRFFKYFSSIPLFLILLIPLIYDNTGFYGYIVPKALLFQCCVIVGSISVLIIKKEPPTISYNPLSIAITAFLLISLIANILSYDNLLSIGATFERMEGAINTIMLCIFFFWLVALINEDKQQKNIFLFMLIISSLVAMWAVLSGKEIGLRLISTIGNPAFLCFYLANHLFLIVIYYIKYQPKYKWLLLLSSLLMVWVIVQTLTRTFYIALMIAGLVMSMLYLLNRVKEQQRRKVFLKGFLISVGVVFILYGLSTVPWIIRNIPMARLKDTSSLSARFLVWGIAAKGFMEHWVLGWGQENFNYVYARFFNPNLAAEGIWYDRSHNVFLDWFVSAGLLGGLAYIFIWISAIYTIQKISLPFLVRLLLTGWVVFYCCFTFFNPDSLVNSIFAMLMLAYIYKHSNTKSITLSFISQNYSVIKIFAIGILATIFYQFTYTNIRSYRTFSKAITEPTIENLIALSNKAYTIRSAVNLNMVEQLTFMHKTVIASGLSLEQKQLYTASIKRLLEKEIQRHPPSVKLLELKSLVEINNNAIATGEETLDKILLLSPDYVNALMQKGKIALVQGRYDDAIGDFDKVIAKAPENVSAKLFRVYAHALKSPDYNLAKGLKQVSVKDLDVNIVFVKEIFFRLGKPQAFVDWVRNGGLDGAFLSKQVYFEWITTAYQNKDLKSVNEILRVYKANHICDSPLLERIAIDAQNGNPIEDSLKELFVVCR
ncbi:O-antigen ligase family protein [Emticicia agri]|uniref:O-antigen ligase-related domain-containing protein n=1 Tax=Emticicia agri TaxID=2492393 RepID=A0A4Q5LX93_9BACT|nr:O-antigen ligase family protein [Emticicia agri]RYU94441.1 hypothetical protein EWM59_16715 [Emticicia agri]